MIPLLPTAWMESASYRIHFPIPSRCLFPMVCRRWRISRSSTVPARPIHAAVFSSTTTCNPASNTDVFACDDSSSVWCTSDQVCRGGDTCFDLGDLCASKFILCSEEYYDFLKADGSGDVGASPLRFICENADCEDTGTGNVGGEVVEPPQDDTSAAFLSVGTRNAMFTTLVTFASTIATIATVCM